MIVVDGDGGDHTLAEVEAMDPDFDPAEIVDEIQLDDLLTLIYTSGTTGPPKGVQLTHRNLMTLTKGVEEIVNFPDRGAKVISWLPAAHIAERGAHYYLPCTRGVSVTICPDPRKIADSLAAVRPTWFFAVPRIYEKLKAGIEASFAKLPDEQREAAQKGVAAAIQKVRLEQAGEEVPEELAAGVAQAEEADVRSAAQQLGFDELVAINVGRRAHPGRGARVLPRDRGPDRRALGNVRDLRRRHLQPTRQGEDRHRRPAGAGGRGEARRGRRGRGEGATR